MTVPCKVLSGLLTILAGYLSWESIVAILICIILTMWIFSGEHHRLREIEKLLERSVCLQLESLAVLQQIAQRLAPEVKGFRITQLIYEGDSPMPTQAPVIGIVAGATGSFLATPVDANGVALALPAGIIPVWVSSDPVNAPVVASADGLTATITTLATAPAGTTFTLSLSATLADGTVPAGTTPVPFLAAVPDVVASFVITQTA